MNTVQTVLGPIPVEKLGRTLVHEHLFIAFEGSQYDPEATFDRPSFITEAVRRLRELKEHGVSTFVDPCPIDLGRDVVMMKEISEKSEMNIVCTTGFYHEHLGLPGYWRVRTAEDIAALYIREIEKGIGDTGIRPGAIKCASSSPAITPLEEKFIIAASIAQRATGLPIITHTDHVCGPEQQEIFTRQGVLLGRCLIGHCCGNADPAYHRRIVEAGSYIGFDRIGGTNHQPDSVRADNIVKLVRDGFASSVLMSQDRFCGMRGRPTVKVPPEIAVKIEHMKKTGKYPPPYTHLFTRFLPMLRERGLTDAEIYPILDRNPMEYFRGPAPT
jgi:phosphotriesterase-related protein